MQNVIRQSDGQTDRRADGYLCSITRGRVRAGPSFQLGTLSTRIAKLLAPAIFVTAQKCPYHVTFDIDLDLEHILDAGSPAWGPSCASLVAIRSLPASALGIIAQTDRQTDRHDLPRAILPERKIKAGKY